MNQPATTDINVSQLLATDAAGGSWVLDPSGSTAEFHVTHFWGAITVRGTFDRISGEATVGAGGTVKGRISFDAGSLSTKNQQRDKHLRSADFFDVEKHPEAVLTVASARPTGPATLECEGTFEAAEQGKPVTFIAHVEEANAQAAMLTATLELDRSELGMTWSPLHTASMKARGIVKARFTRG